MFGCFSLVRQCLQSFSSIKKNNVFLGRAQPNKRLFVLVINNYFVTQPLHIVRAHNFTQSNFISSNNNSVQLSNFFHSFRVQFELYGSV
jgi:hypothetical protein